MVGASCTNPAVAWPIAPSAERVTRDELNYRLLRILESDPEISQRRLAQELGISLGRTNYCLRALIDKGLVKAGNFYRSKHKLGYAYLLTPHGLEEKTRMTRNFLARKLAEHQAITEEIARLRKELSDEDADASHAHRGEP